MALCADRRHFAFRPQQFGLFQRSEIQIDPLLFVTGKREDDL